MKNVYDEPLLWMNELKHVHILYVEFLESQLNYCLILKYAIGSCTTSQGESRKL